MLSIGAMKNGQAEYYLSLSREDYYLEGGEPAGKWLGDGAIALRLGETVKAADLKNLFKGFCPNGKKLVQNAGKENRQPGWDLTFSAPKSVSVLWSQVDGEQQVAIQQAHEKAVEAAIRFLEKEYATSRVGKGGVEITKAKMVVAAFEHSCSRALDPQLHTHALVLNIGVDDMGKTRSLVSRSLYQAKMLAGAYYRAALAYQLRSSMQLKTYRPLNRRNERETWFEVTGVSKAVMQHFSKRREEILEQLGSVGLDTASAAAYATLSTRSIKDVVPPRSELKARWTEEGNSVGFNFHDLATTRAISLTQQRKFYQESLTEAVAKITFAENYFTTEELMRRTLEASQSHGLSAEFVAEQVKSDLNKNQQFESLGMREGKQYWTTKDVLRLEEGFLSNAKQLQERSFRAVSNRKLEKTLAKKRGTNTNAYFLDSEQQNAVRYITQGSEALKVITGFAGTGKTDMLAASKEALEASGYRIVGTALATVAARELQDKTGIQSDTIRIRELQLNASTKETLKHHARQLTRAAFKKKTFKQEKLTIDAKTVLVIDEAGMVGTRDFYVLFEAVKRQGGSVVVVGDQWQLPSIERGGCLGTLSKLVDGCHLTQIRRQQDAHDRLAVKDIATNDVEAFLRNYAEKGQLVVSSSHKHSESSLISEWKKAGGTDCPLENRIFASTHKEVDRYNSLAQWERVKTGLCNPLHSVEHNGKRFMVGDAVTFATTNRKLGITKAETGTVVACKEGFTGKYVAVNVSDACDRAGIEAIAHHAQQLIKKALGKKTNQLTKTENIVLVPIKSINPRQETYADLRLNYCQTVHAGQGQTVKNAYVHLGGRFSNRELTYVQGSRHKERLMLFAEEKEAGKALAELASTNSPKPQRAVEVDVPNYSALVSQMKVSRATAMAHEVAHANLRNS